MDLPYVMRLSARLADGLATLPEEDRDRHAAFVATCLQPDGGYRGREGESDLYYTSFAVRSLVMVDRLDADVRTAVAGYLRDIAGSEENVIDLMSWLYCGLALAAAGGPDVLSDRPDLENEMRTALARFRHADGGFATHPDARYGSTYHTFLAALAYEMFGASVPDAAAALAFLKTRQREDGGFVEIPPMRRSGTNPTAAAVGAMLVIDAVPADVRDRVADFFPLVQGDDGGLLANTKVPLSDSLSTFTGLLTLQDIAADGIVDYRKLRAFLAECADPAGGYRGGWWDEEADCEFTFYGLGIHALCAGR